MKLNGAYKFQAWSAEVFQALLNPEVLKACIPGCKSVEYLDAENVRASITTPLPGLRGPYGITIHIAQRQDPKFLEIKVQRKGTGGAINAVSLIELTDEPDGALLTYHANADLEGVVAIANNPLGEGAIKKSLGSFFHNLDQFLSR